MEVDVGNRACTAILVLDASTLTCFTPAGSGELIEIVVRLRISDEDYLQSNSFMLLGKLYPSAFSRSCEMSLN